MFHLCTSVLLLAATTIHGFDKDSDTAILCKRPNVTGLVVTPNRRVYKEFEAIQLSCEEGYRITNYRTESTCRYFPAGSFDNQGSFLPPIVPWICNQNIPKCEAPDVQGVVISPMKPSYEPGESIEISCKEGYELKGESTIVCRYPHITNLVFYPRSRHKGYFFPSLTRHTCVDTCKRPNVPGLVVTPNRRVYKEFETIQLSCEEGYRFTNSRTESTCRYFPDGSLNNQSLFFPRILPRTCKKLPRCKLPKNHGLVINDSKPLYEDGEKITISCKDGFELVGPDTFTCTITDGEIATFGTDVNNACQDIPKCEFPDVQGVVISPMKPSYETGESIRISCKEGYELKGESTSVCRYPHIITLVFYPRSSHKGYFYPSLTRHTCVDTAGSCKRPNVPGLVVTPNRRVYKEFETIQLSCEEGYRFNNSRTESTCRYFNGLFDNHGLFVPLIRPRTCKRLPLCRRPKEQGLIIKDSKTLNEEGENITMSCEDGFE